jgi:hypothetical protein
LSAGLGGRFWLLNLFSQAGIFFLVAGFSPTAFKDMRILIVAVLGNLQIWLEASFAGFNKDMSCMMQIIE